MVAIGGAQWKDKAVSAGVATALGTVTGGAGLLLLGPSALGSYRQAKLPGRIMRYIEEVLPLCVRD